MKGGLSKKMESKAFWLLFGLIGLALGSLGTLLFIPPTEVVKEVPVVTEKVVTVEIPGPETIVEVPVEVPTEGVWSDRAWERVLDEYEGSDNFLTCDGVEYDDDEFSFRIEDVNVETGEKGDVEVTLNVDFKFEDSSDEHPCREEREFLVSWDKKDVRKADWDEAEVDWI